MEKVEIVKIYLPEERARYYDSNDVELHVGDWCIVEGKYSPDIGEVLWKYNMPAAKGPKSMLKVLRQATKKEIKLAEDNRVKARQAFKICQRRIAARHLPMKLSKVKYTLDGERIVFYFISERPVDFRNLVGDLSKTFRKRIELVRIGVRDETAIVGGCGPCGRALCCATFIQEFHSIAIKMAKNQDMNLTPEKISGICGRLLCCLEYEHDWYIETKKKMPKLKARVRTPQGLGIVEEVNLFKETVRVYLDQGEMVELDIKNIRPVKQRRER